VHTGVEGNGRMDMLFERDMVLKNIAMDSVDIIKTP